MQIPDILMRLNADQTPGIALPNLDKLRLKRQNILLAPGSESIRISLPKNLPIAARPPAVLVDVEAEVVVAEEELGGVALNVDGFDIFALGNEVEGGIGLVE